MQVALTFNGNDGTIQAECGVLLHGKTENTEAAGKAERENDYVSSDPQLRTIFW